MATHLIDVKLVNRPSSFDGSEVKWSNWKFVFESYLCCLDANYLLELTEAAASPTVIIERDWWPADRIRRSRALYAILVSLVQGKALEIVRTVRTQSGYEVLSRCRRPGS